MVSPISEYAKWFIQWTCTKASENASELARSYFVSVEGKVAEPLLVAVLRVQYRSTCLFPALEKSLHAGVVDART